MTTRTVAEARRLEWDEGLTRADIARRLGVSTSTISRWLGGEPAPGTIEAAERAAARELQARDWTNSNRADGRKVVDWLERQELLYEEDGSDLGSNGATGSTPIHRPRLRLARHFTEGTLRTLLKWRNGNPARLDAIDTLLTSLGRHVSELPDDVWL